MDIYDEVTVNTKKLTDIINSDTENQDGTFPSLVDHIKKVDDIVFIPSAIILGFGKPESFFSMEAGKKGLAIKPIKVYTDRRGSWTFYGMLIGPNPDKLIETEQRYLSEFALRSGTYPN